MREIHYRLADMMASLPTWMPIYAYSARLDSYIAKATNPLTRKAEKVQMFAIKHAGLHVQTIAMLSPFVILILAVFGGLNRRGGIFWGCVI